MRIIEDKITLAELDEMAEKMFGDLVKTVVDIKKGVMAVDAELHADLEAFLLQNGSGQNDLWGINIYPKLHKDDFIEYDSMINLRPSQENQSRGVENIETRKKIFHIVNKLVSR